MNVSLHDDEETAAVPGGAVAAAPHEIARTLLPMRPADAVEALNGLDPEAATGVLDAMPLDTAIALFHEPHLDRRADLIARMPPERAVAVLEGLYPDRRAASSGASLWTARRSAIDHADPHSSQRR